jgi:hypothetical protein
MISNMNGYYLTLFYVWYSIFSNAQQHLCWYSTKELELGDKILDIWRYIIYFYYVWILGALAHFAAALRATSFPSFITKHEYHTNNVE